MNTLKYILGRDRNPVRGCVSAILRRNTLLFCVNDLNPYGQRPHAVAQGLHVMHMSETKQFNVLGIVGIIGALLMVIGVFLNWLEFSVTIPIIGSESWNYTGMDIFNTDIIGEGDNAVTFSDITSYSYAPIVALACGVISIIATIVSTVLCKGNIGKIMGAIALILAIVAIVLGFLFYGDVSGYAFSESIFGFSASLSIGAGLWVVIAGAIITVIGGILDIAKKTN